MQPHRLRDLLSAVRDGDVDVDDALARLRDLPFEDTGDARLDHHRALRTGLPEVVFGQGKTPEQIADIMGRLAAHSPVVLTTRATPDAYAAVRE